MKEAHLLHTHTRIRTNGRQTFVQMRKIQAEYPMEHLSMDVKYVYIPGERRNVYLLTVMDIFTRRVLGHLFKPSIRQHDVVLLMDGIIRTFPVKKMTIRNDNGSQFIANSVRKYLFEQGINQEFTHIATSEENAVFRNEVIMSHVSITWLIPCRSYNYIVLYLGFIVFIKE